MNTHSDIDRVFANARSRIDMDLVKFEKEFRAATENGAVPNIDEIENFSIECSTKINNSLTEMYADALTNINESELIASKKENTGRKE